MIAWTATASSTLASFMGSTVEFVEALTIVLAVGVVRGWRSTLLGVAAALAVLGTLVALLGPWLARLSLPAVQLCVGILLLLFGMRWLRKAILRAAGVLALHDESQAYAATASSLLRLGASGPRAIDTLAFGTAFKIVMLEGIEVVFIVIAIGTRQKMMLPASVGALLALVAVAILGLILHRPLARVPENQLKFGVGVLLSAFGTFWVGEGVGLAWPGADWALLALIGAFLVVALVLVRFCERLRVPPPSMPTSPLVAADTPARPSALAAIGGELLGLFVDDGWLAAGIVICVHLVWITANRGGMDGGLGGTLFMTLLAALLAASSLRSAGV
jgi:uncharacterized membrane protein